ncbi:MAG: tryptophan synthase subunit alpha [Planctomycetes bacterium]|nr:tryptophan synthase subunit alpha [Planctomycetota bacterium]
MAECLLMAHMIAGYPNMDASMNIAKALAAGGADYLEVQFPFSDPTADGPLIERASQTALDNGFRVEAGFAFLRRVKDEVGLPLFIMTYGSLVFARGAKWFADQSKHAGVEGLIIPDLPPDYDEHLFEAGAAAGLAVTPVIAPEITDARLRMIGDMKPQYIYTALRLGITGSKTSLDDATISYLDKVGASGAKIIAGFGVRSREQMVALSGHAHAAAVGSYFLEVMDESKGNETTALTRAARGLKG